MPAYSSPVLYSEVTTSEVGLAFFSSLEFGFPIYSITGLPYEPSEGIMNQVLLGSYGRPVKL